MTMNSQLAAFNDLYHQFQPVCNLPGERILGHEALIRSKHQIQPNKLFQHAQTVNKLLNLDLFSIHKAITDYFHTRKKAPSLLFVNVFPSTIADRYFPIFIDQLVLQFGAFCSRIVFEINESITERSIWNQHDFMNNIDYLREQGFLFALDDVGEGTATLKRIVQITPHFIKMDKFFSTGLASSPRKQKALKLFIEYCRGESLLILEGIEQHEDMSTAISLGVQIGQGYYLGQPSCL